MFPINEQTTVVTGGCSGIGYALVKAFLERGMKNVAILDIQDPNNVTGSLRSNYSRQNVVFFKTDVTKKEQIKSAFTEIVSQFGPIDLVVGCAGVLNEKDYELTINVNVLGVLHTTYTAMEFMDKREGGRGGVIINIASHAGLVGYTILPSYCASKHAVIGLVKSLGDDFFFEKYGIKCIAICPTLTDTPMIFEWENRLNDEVRDIAQNTKETGIIQSPDSVAECVCEIFMQGKNGSVWILHNGKKHEVTPENSPVAT